MSMSSPGQGKHPSPGEAVFGPPPAVPIWRRESSRGPSMGSVFQSIAIPQGAGFWRKLLAFVGPGYLIAVGYMDPGNWATDIAGGSQFAYTLLSMVLISSLLAIFLQALSAKIGIATGKDLAQACRDTYSKPVYYMLWFAAEVGIIACEIAEVLGAAIALNLLFHLPLIWGVLVTSVDVILILGLQKKGFRWIEAIVVGLIGAMTIIFGVEIAFSHPAWLSVWRGFIPQAQVVTNPKILYVALGILGATVMPHNLYLHSSIVQTRRYGDTPADRKQAVTLAAIDSTVALTFALLVNAAILIVAAAVFYQSGHHEVGAIEDAYKLISPLVGVAVAAPLFAIALLASGLNATLTGTLASQIVLEGFIHVKISPLAIRMISRALAIVPSIIAIAVYGSRGTGMLLVFSQVVLSAALPFAVIPLLQITGDKRKMGPLVNSRFATRLGWLVAGAITVLNGWLIVTSLRS